MPPRPLARIRPWTVQSRAASSSSLDSLRTVEFRQTLARLSHRRRRRVSRTSCRRCRGVAGADAPVGRATAGRPRSASPNSKACCRRSAARSRPRPARRGRASDDTLQRTLLLAQKFVDQTQAEAEAQARLLVADAEDRARRVLGEAEQRAKSVTEETERHLREDDHPPGVHAHPAGRRRRDHRPSPGERAQPLARRVERHVDVGRRARAAGRLAPGPAQRAAADGAPQRRPAHREPVPAGGGDPHGRRARLGRRSAGRDRRR